MSNRRDILYITDIRESIEAIFSYTVNCSFKDFSSDRMKYSAVIREFEIIGEAVSKLSDSLKNEHGRLTGKTSKTSATYLYMNILESTSK